MTDSERPTKVDMDQALLDPGSVFATPEALLLHDGLSKQQKIEILHRWEYDASENCVAVEEGMPDGESDLLRRILLALDRLTGGIDVEHVGPTKQHGIPRSAVKPK
jgi:hypothetical protein